MVWGPVLAVVDVAIRGMSLDAAVAAVDKIRAYLKERGLQLSTDDSGVAHWHKNWTTALTVHATHASSVRGLTQGQCFRLDHELGSDGAICVEVILPRNGSCVSTMTYLLVQPGEDPVTVFTQFLANLFGRGDPTLGSNPLMFLIPEHSKGQ